MRFKKNLGVKNNYELEDHRLSKKNTSKRKLNYRSEKLTPKAM